MHPPAFKIKTTVNIEQTLRKFETVKNRKSAKIEQKCFQQTLGVKHRKRTSALFKMSHTDSSGVSEK